MDTKKTTTTSEVRSCHVQKAIKYMNEFYEEDLNLEEMSKQLGLNKCYFCDLFKKETGKTYSQVLNEVRIEKSKYLLNNKKLNILEVALSVGYNNPNYYSMVFKRFTGLTPLKYRQQMHEKLSFSGCS